MFCNWKWLVAAFSSHFYCKRWFLVGENLIISTIFLLQIARKQITDYTWWCLLCLTNRACCFLLSRGWSLHSICSISYLFLMLQFKSLSAFATARECGTAGWGAAAGNSPRVSVTAVSTTTCCYFWNSKLETSTLAQVVKVHKMVLKKTGCCVWGGVAHLFHQRWSLVASNGKQQPIEANRVASLFLRLIKAI